MVFVMCSCNLTPVPQYESVETDLPIEGFINDFLVSNPKFFNNDITIEEGNKDFIKNLEDTLKTTDGKMNLFDGIPVRLKTIHKNKRLGGYVAQFDSWIEPDNFDFHYVSEINFDVFCEIPDSVAFELKENKHYVLDGVYVGHLTYYNYTQFLGKTTSVWSPIVKIEKDKTYISDYFQRKVNLGCVLLFVDDIKEYTHRETQLIEVK
jgi:hypothetical protein